MYAERKFLIYIVAHLFKDSLTIEYREGLQKLTETIHHFMYVYINNCTEVTIKNVYHRDVSPVKAKQRESTLKGPCQVNGDFGHMPYISQHKNCVIQVPLYSIMLSTLYNEWQL